MPTTSGSAKPGPRSEKGEPGLALARYRAHDRLHVYDTRAEATQAMVENWDQNRQGLPPDQTVMITDSSNEERDEMNALAQDRRAQAGELGQTASSCPASPTASRPATR